MNTGYSILKVLVYFDIFDYPLTQEEIRFYLDKCIKDDELANFLSQLMQENKIRKHGEFFSLQNEKTIAEKRIKGNEKAAMLLARAEKIARRLYGFPYVRAIGVSGSVSKNFAGEDADIDYFIISKANRLWIARTLMHLFKKLPFLKNRNRHYCMNYYIDEAGLLIEEKNIYTATELVTLRTMAGNGSMQKFFEANNWAKTFFPNQSFENIGNNDAVKDSWLKKFLEFLLNNRFGDRLDDYFFRLTTRRWKLKEQQQRLNTKGERMGLKTSKHCSKPNPVFFHDWFLEKYETRLSELRAKWNLQNEEKPVYP